MPDNLFYIHLQADGNISVLGPNDTLKPIPEFVLREILKSIAAEGRAVVFSLDSPDFTPDQPQPIRAVLDLVQSYGVPLKFLTGGNASAYRPSDPGYFSPLMMTAAGGHLEWMDELLRRRVEVDARDEHGYTALMFATNSGHCDAAQRLLEAGADVNAEDNDASSPLMFAAQRGDLRLVQLLLAAGANPNHRGDHAFTALRFALQNGHAAVADALRAAGGTG